MNIFNRAIVILEVVLLIVLLIVSAVVPNTVLNQFAYTIERAQSTLQIEWPRSYLIFLAVAIPLIFLLVLLLWLEIRPQSTNRVVVRGRDGTRTEVSTRSVAQTLQQHVDEVEDVFNVKASVRGLILVNTYIPQGHLADSDRFQYKLDWFRRLLDYLRTSWRPTDPILWMGDLNVAPLPIDVYDPATLLGHVCYHPRVHEALEKIVQWGFTDVFRMHCRDPGQYTFWDYRLGTSFQRNRGWRLDHILATQPLAERCTVCSIDTQPRTANRPSDHTPVVADFDW